MRGDSGKRCFQTEGVRGDTGHDWEKKEVKKRAGEGARG